VIGQNFMVKVKICGITNLKDARHAVEAGADFLGFNFYPGSPRYIAPAVARRIVQRLPKGAAGFVGVFVNEPEEKMLAIARRVGLNYLQLHGEESPKTVSHLKRTLPVIKAIRIQKSFRTAQLERFHRGASFLLDGFSVQQRGGTGKSFDWMVARRAKKSGRIFLAGGLTPGNVSKAIRAAQPYAVDVCSGVETKPGRKDSVLMTSFVQTVRATQRKTR
jgi:phosphoribosylanthranilate isomerase